MPSPHIRVGMYVPAKPPLAAIDQLVGAALELELDSVMVWDHLVDFVPSALWDNEFTWLARAGGTPHQWFDFQSLLGYLGAKVPALRLGVGVAEAIRRHPIVLAQSMLTLSHLSPRPPILGIGSGESMNTERFGLTFRHAVDRLEEALQILHLAFRSNGPFDFEGRHYRLKDAIVDVQPLPGSMPEIWVAAHGPRMLQLTGRYGDGWYPFAVASPDDYAARLAVIHTAARTAGRDPALITPAFHPITVVAPTEQEARAMLSSPVVRFFGLLFPDDIWQLFGLEHPFGRGFQGYLGQWPLTHDRSVWADAVDKVPPAMMEGLLWGTPDQITARLRAFGEAGLRYVVPFMASAAISQQAASFSIEALGMMRNALQTGS